MINIFQMNPAMSATGSMLSCNSKTSDNAGDSLFSVLLNDLSGVGETDRASLTTDSTGSPDTGRRSDRASDQSSDFLLPASAMSNLESFLENKGFSPEQIDAMLLSSRNDEGFIQIHKLVEAIQSARAGTLSDGTGVFIDPAYVPRVEEMLFKMGFGVGEVKAIVENAGDKRGGLSLDKLVEAVNGQLDGSLSKTDMVSLLEQNNISVTSQAPDTAAAPGSENSINNQAVYNRNYDININSRNYDIDKAAAELKKEFMDFIEGRSRRLGELENPDTALHLKAQARWQKGDREKITDILNSEKISNAGVSDKQTIKEQVQMPDDPAEFLKQGDQKIKQEILAGINGNKTTNQAQTTEEMDINEGLLNLKETQTIDPNSQNITKIAGSFDIKSHPKSLYNLPEPLPGVLDRMVIMIKNGEQSGRLVIQPPELGKIDIDLTVKNGHVQANLSTENFLIKEIIEANLDQLKQQLTDQGLVVEQFNVSVGSHNRQFEEESGQAVSSGNTGVSGIDDITAAACEETDSIIMSNRYRIDLHV